MDVIGRGNMSPNFSRIGKWYLPKVWKTGFGVNSQGSLMTLELSGAITGTGPAGTPMTGRARVKGYCNTAGRDVEARQWMLTIK